MTVARRAGVLGHPISHSLSPVLHRAAYAALGLDWEYSAHDVERDTLGAFIAELGDDWIGLSLTMPLKVEVLRHLDFVEPLARRIGAVNTVLIQAVGDGRQLVGANTDVYGVTQALREGGVLEVTDAVILGGGATATSAMAALAEAGCLAPVVAVRDRSRAGGLMRAASALGIEPSFVTLDAIGPFVERARVVVSTIPAEAGAAVGAALGSVSKGAVLLDAIYSPAVTPLMAEWERRGGFCVGGARMLLHQAGEQVRLMTGQPAPIGEMDRALVSQLSH